MHVINHPDSLGLACDFEQRGLPIDSASPSNLWEPIAPNVPNYSLGALVGSGCDTLTSTSNVQNLTFSFSVYPNPVSNELQLSISGATTKAFLEINDVLGRTIYRKTLEPTDHSIHQAVDMSKFASGVYFVSLSVNGKRFNRNIVKK